MMIDVSGMRPIVNMGRSSHMSFLAPRAPAGGRSHRRGQRIRLSFRPINFHLQSLHQVSILPPTSSLCNEASPCISQALPCSTLQNGSLQESMTVYMRCY